MTLLNTQGNAFLSCITIDDNLYLYYNWINVSAGVQFSTNCSNSCYLSAVKLSAPDSKITVFPNPTQGQVSISLNEYSKVLKIKLFNSFGQLMNPEIFVDVDQLMIDILGPKGFYFLQIYLKSGESRTVKIIKQ